MWKNKNTFLMSESKLPFLPYYYCHYYIRSKKVLFIKHYYHYHDVSFHLWLFLHFFLIWNSNFIHCYTKTDETLLCSLLSHFWTWNTRHLFLSSISIVIYKKSVHYQIKYIKKLNDYVLVKLKFKRLRIKYEIYHLETIIMCLKRQSYPMYKRCAIIFTNNNMIV